MHTKDDIYLDLYCEQKYSNAASSQAINVLSSRQPSISVCKSEIHYPLKPVYIEV